MCQIELVLLFLAERVAVKLQVHQLMHLRAQGKQMKSKNHTLHKTTLIGNRDRGAMLATRLLP